MLFHVVNDRHKHKRSMVFTTNKALKAWGAVLHDEDLAHAIVDRILERGRILHLDGPSMRTRHLGLDDLTTEAVSTQTGRISGIGRAEFPEPTKDLTGRAGTPRISINYYFCGRHHGERLGHVVVEFSQLRGSTSNDATTILAQGAGINRYPCDRNAPLI